MSSTAVSYHSPMLVLDPDVCHRIIQQRHERTADRHDEVWEGVYVLSPNPTNEHQRLIFALARVFDEVVSPIGGTVLPEINVTDREDDWEYNFRCPDIAVMLPGCRAKDIDVAILGGPDFLVEVRSPYDKTIEKLDFYARIGVCELLVVDHETKELELFALRDNKLHSQGQSTAESPIAVTSGVLPLSFLWQDGESAQIVIRRTDGKKDEWLL